VVVRDVCGGEAVRCVMGDEVRCVLGCGGGVVRDPGGACIVAP